MNRKEAERLTHQENVLLSLGFTRDEAESLRRISMTLHRWHELECGTEGGCIERDEKTGRPHWLYSGGGFGERRSIAPIPDRETSAKKRLRRIIDARNDRRLMSGEQIDVQNPPLLRVFIQGDPRGAALYILRPGDVPEGQSVDAYYSRGICVY